MSRVMMMEGRSGWHFKEKWESMSSESKGHEGTQPPYLRPSLILYFFHYISKLYQYRIWYDLWCRMVIDVLFQKSTKFLHPKFVELTYIMNYQRSFSSLQHVKLRNFFFSPSESGGKLSNDSSSMLMKLLCDIINRFQIEMCWSLTSLLQVVAGNLSGKNPGRGREPQMRGGRGSWVPRPAGSLAVEHPQLVIHGLALRRHLLLLLGRQVPEDAVDGRHLPHTYKTQPWLPGRTSWDQQKATYGPTLRHLHKL